MKKIKYCKKMLSILSLTTLLMTSTLSTNALEAHIIYGDVDGSGRTDSADYYLVRSYLLGIRNDFPDANGIKAADVNGDKIIDTADHYLIKSYILRKITEFPAETSSQGAIAPLLDILPKFTAGDVPVLGPEEQKIDSTSWSVPSTGTGPELPGGGISRYPMLYIGEGYNKIFLVDKGKVIWTYSTGQGEEYDDIWMMTNGNILYTRQSYVAEVNPQKKEVWRYKAPSGSEIHTSQPIGLDKVLMAVNANPPKLVIVNKATGKVEMEHTLPHEKPEDVHGQFRRVRMTEKGTFLVSYLSVGKVVEFDKDFNEIWSYKIRSPWAAIRLKNGNTLISSEKLGLVREVNAAGETVWEFKMSDLPSEYSIPDSQSCVRLDNGNTILCSRGNSGNNPQLIEVTPDKKVVWVLKDWKDLGPATAVQILSDPGVPENPGECQR